jgi:hypothetical protein
VIQEKRTHDAKIITDLKKRKLLRMQKIISFRISKGPKFALQMVKEETDLTAEMLASGAWKTAAFSESCLPARVWVDLPFNRALALLSAENQELTLSQSRITSTPWARISTLAPCTP